MYHDNFNKKLFEEICKVFESLKSTFASLKVISGRCVWHRTRIVEELEFDIKNILHILDERMKSSDVNIGNNNGVLVRDRVDDKNSSSTFTGEVKKWVVYSELFNKIIRNRDDLSTSLISLFENRS